MFERGCYSTTPSPFGRTGGSGASLFRAYQNDGLSSALRALFVLGIKACLTRFTLVVCILRSGLGSRLLELFDLSPDSFEKSHCVRKHTATFVLNIRKIADV